MSTTVDVFIKYNGSKAQLIRILARDFLILVGKKEYWFLNLTGTRDSDRGQC